MVAKYSAFFLFTARVYTYPLWFHYTSTSIGPPSPSPFSHCFRFSLVSPSFSSPLLQYDRRAPQYTTTFQTTRQHVDARMSHVKLNLKEKTMVNLVAVGKSIAAVLKWAIPLHDSTSSKYGNINWSLVVCMTHTSLIPIFRGTGLGVSLVVCLVD